MNCVYKNAILHAIKFGAANAWHTRGTMCFLSSQLIFPCKKHLDKYLAAVWQAHLHEVRKFICIDAQMNEHRIYFNAEFVLHISIVNFILIK